MLTVHFPGAVIGGLNTRRGTIIDSKVCEDDFMAVVEVVLNDMFGYSSQLRRVTQGKGKFSMECKVGAFLRFDSGLDKRR